MCMYDPVVYFYVELYPFENHVQLLTLKALVNIVFS